NMAYFSNEVSLKDMMKHIYGEKPVENHSNRPHMFIKELYLYIDHLQQQIQSSLQLTPQKIKKLEAFKNNLLDGISYYRELFSGTTFFRNENGKIQSELNVCEAQVKNMKVTPELV